jgi:hypothetical protein
MGSAPLANTGDMSSRERSAASPVPNDRNGGLFKALNKGDGVDSESAFEPCSRGVELRPLK